MPFLCAQKHKPRPIRHIIVRKGAWYPLSEIKKITVGGAVFTVIFGTLLHFVFQWSGRSPAAGIIGAVNESTWEHLKLIFFPMLFYGVFEFFKYGRKYKNFLPAKAACAAVGMLIIVVTFYTYTGILGRNFLPLDIITFLLGTAGAYFTGYKILSFEKFSSEKAKTAAAAVLMLLLFLFVTFTFIPPEIPLFLDPVTGKYSF